MNISKKQSGFTLVELAVTVSIIAVIAITSTAIYTSYVRKSRRSEAISDILGIQVAEEKYRTSNNTYGTIAQVWNKTTTDSGAYNLSVSGTSATAYTITATAVGGQTSDSEDGTSCSVLTLTMSNGIQTKTPANCWK